MYRVLLVDDEYLIRESVTKIVDWKQKGFELVKVCEDGQDAVKYLEKNSVDLVITDIDMPYMNGLDLSQYIYTKYPDTFIVILSGYDDFVYAKRAIEYEVSEYILKPFTSEEFNEILDKIKKKLDRKQEEDTRIHQLTEGYRKYTRNESLILSKYLCRLIMGTQDIDYLRKELKEYEIDLSGKAFRIVIVCIDLFSEWCDDNMGRVRDSALISYTIENICQEVIGRHGAGIAFRDSDDRICLLARTSRPQTFRSQIREICREIQQYVINT